MLRSASKHWSSSFRRIPAATATQPQRGLAVSRTPGTPEEPRAKEDTTNAESMDAPDSAADSKRVAKKTMAELDEEMRQKMAALAGDGGESGVEYEDGQPVAMKRSVKSNMFRYI